MVALSLSKFYAGVVIAVLATVCFIGVCTLPSSPCGREYERTDEDAALLAEENENLFEGDIMLTDAQKLIISKAKNVAKNAEQKRDIISFTHYQWKSNQIPYKFDYGFSCEGQDLVRIAMKDIEDLTCVQFVERKWQRDYIKFINGTGCYSNVGRLGGKQIISIGKNCLRKGTILHECLHALGLFHEHTRFDRDKYVTVHWENIEAGKEHNFEKYGVNNIEEPYDFFSIMHYPEWAFSVDVKRGKRYWRKTITAKQHNGKLKIGQRMGLSETDIRQINKLFNCPGIYVAPDDAVIHSTKQPALNLSENVIVQNQTLQTQLYRN